MKMRRMNRTRGHNPPCPWLPAAGEIHDHTITRRHGTDRGPAFYLDALRYAQSLWKSGLPAQAILQLNKAWLADLGDSDPVLAAHPPPYRALAWMMQQCAHSDCGFLGNPVRHFQHLASRMRGPRTEIRRWRAWFCMHLSECALPAPGHPRDGRQIAREGLWIPGINRTLGELHLGGWRNEAHVAHDAIPLARDR
jgi:hypothetical protein